MTKNKKYSCINIKDIYKDIKFVTIAEWGAMGNAGEIELLCRKDGINTRYFGNMFFGKKIIDMDNLKISFPDINNMHCFMLPCDYSFNGWKYYNLGMGNNLYVSDDICSYFEYLIENLTILQLYSTLYKYSFLTLMLLEKGYKNKKDFLNFCQENNILENEPEYISVEINNKLNSYHSKKRN